MNMDIVQEHDSFKAHQEPSVNSTVDSMLAEIAKLPIPPTAKYVGTIMVTMRLIDSKALAEFTGIPLRSVQRAMLQISASGVIGAMSATSGAPAASSTPPVALIEVSEPRTHARIELPSEVLNLEVKKDTPQPPKGPGKAECLEAFHAFNATAQRCGLPQARSLTPAREASVRCRLREHGMAGWMQALSHIERSSFLTGTNDRNWRLSFGWFLKTENFTKVFEGTYGNGRHAKVSPPVRKVYDQFAEQAARRAMAEQMMREDGLLS
jgi:hypothetical protein